MVLMKTMQIIAPLAIASTLTVGLVGCSPATTPSNPVAGTSTSSAAQVLVDVSAVWATHPMPDCPRVVKGNATASPGIVLPDDASVAKELAGVKSPGSEGWVRTKLGWVTQALSITRADIIGNVSDASANKAEAKGFERYVGHVRDELSVGHDISNPVDGDYPEGCRE